MSSRAQRDLLRVAFWAGTRRSSGALQIESREGTARFEVRRGEAFASDDRTSWRELERALDALARLPHHASFVTSATIRPIARGEHLSLAELAVRLGVRAVTVDRARAFATEARGEPIVLATRLDPAWLAEPDRPIARALERRGSLGETASVSRAPLFRVIALVAFLSEVGALGPSRVAAAAPARAPADDPRAIALETLGLPPDASPSLAKTMFRRLARSLHPDAHPTASAQEKSELTRSLARLTAAYAALAATPQV